MKCRHFVRDRHASRGAAESATRNGNVYTYGIREAAYFLLHIIMRAMQAITYMHRYVRFYWVNNIL